MRRDQHNSGMAVYDSMQGGGGYGMQQGMIPAGYGGGMGGGFPGMGGMPGMGGAGAGAEPKGESVWQLVNDRMQGRWKMATIIGLTAAAVLGVAGFMSAVPMYQSTAVIRITPNAAITIERTPEWEAWQRNYSRFVATQVQMMKQGRVLEQALLDPGLAKLPLAARPDAFATIRANLDVQADRDSELTYMSYRSPNGSEAYGVANAVVHAYYKVCVENENTVTKTLNEVATLEQATKSALKGVSDDRNLLTTKYQTPDLHELSKRNTSMIAELSSQISVGERLLARARQQAQPGAAAALADVTPTDRQLEEFEPKLAMLRQLRDDAQHQLESIQDLYNKNTFIYKDKFAKSETATRLYEQKRDEAIAAYKKTGGDPALVRGSQFDGKSPEQIEQDLAGYKAELEEVKSAQRELLADIQKFELLTISENTYRDDLKNVQARRSSLEREKNALAGVITIANEASKPQYPEVDSRKRMAIMGAGAGLLLSFGVFFALGSIDRRAYGAAQLHQVAGSNLPPCLGVLPDLGASISDPESSDVASHCVHQIRNQIEAVREPQNGYVLAISSPFQGDGKTSIVMALGWSYAAAGYSTLLIDCDMVGRSLTRQLGLIGREGLKEALVSRVLNGSVTRMGVDNLSAVAVGVDARYGPENVRRVDLERLIDQVREKYDIIIMDTGPLLGSLESTPVTAIANGVVLSVRRGRSRAKLEECVARLGMVGTRCIGIILNCAVRSDCNRYVSEASLAAAEEDRGNRPVVDNTTAVIQPLPGERNALVRAMQNTVRNRTGDG